MSNGYDFMFSNPFTSNNGNHIDTVNSVTSRNIIYGKHNDNYCDCIGGGEDELETDACSYYTPRKPIMKCKPKIDNNSKYRHKLAIQTQNQQKGKIKHPYSLRGNKKKEEILMIRGMSDRLDIEIYASKYRDGICDCRDCEDEK